MALYRNKKLLDFLKKVAAKRSWKVPEEVAESRRQLGDLRKAELEDIMAMQPELADSLSGAPTLGRDVLGRLPDEVPEAMDSGRLAEMGYRS